ncbi:Transcription factor spt20 [Basidiobolus ranarum]|uniref:Transcription factor spt20 n=1 Tax=Basidiobolus ranarum TaxID=34480 RepID=A0ABR2VUL3_9FUNG
MHTDRVNTIPATPGQSLKPDKLLVDKNTDAYMTSLHLKHPVPFSELCPKDFLERYNSSPPSFILHIYPTYFKFEKQDGVFLFTSSTKSFLDHLNDFEIPPEFLDIFDEARCPYYEGCIIAEIHDHRPNLHSEQSSETLTNIQRVVLHPTSETLWADLCLMNETSDVLWNEDFSLQVESKILLATEAPLCLDPSFQVTRITNTLCYGKPEAHRSRKKPRKRVPVEIETEVAEKEENYKLMMMMDERYQKNFQPTFNRMSFIKDWRKRKSMLDAEPSSGLQEKPKDKRPALGLASPIDEYQVVRTLRFERECGGKKIYTLLNIYHDAMTSNYEGVLRTGHALDTSIEGNTLRFLIGPKDVLEEYIANIRKIYGLDNTLISDNSLDTHETTPISSIESDSRLTALSLPQPPNHAPLSTKLTQTIKSSSIQHSTQIQAQHVAKKSVPSQPKIQSTQTPRQINTQAPLQSNDKLASSLSTASTHTGNMSSHNAQALSAQSNISKLLNSISLQQLTQNGSPIAPKDLSGLTPQQINHLKLQLLRKKQLLMQRQLNQQQSGPNPSPPQPTASMVAEQTSALQSSLQTPSPSLASKNPTSLLQRKILRPSLSTLQPSSAQVRAMLSQTPIPSQNPPNKQLPVKPTNLNIPGQINNLPNGGT